MLRSHTRTEKNVMLGLHCAQLWEEEQQLEQLVLLETQVAARLAAVKAGKPQLLPPVLGDGQQLSERDRVKQIAQLAGGLPKDHDLAMCMLPRHSGHMNVQCKSPDHPRNRQLLLAPPAGAAYLADHSPAAAGSSSSVIDALAAVLMQHAPHTAAGASNGYRGNSSSNPRTFNQQPVAPQTAAPRPVPQQLQQDPCNYCKGGRCPACATTTSQTVLHAGGHQATATLSSSGTTGALPGAGNTSHAIRCARATAA